MKRVCYLNAGLHGHEAESYYAAQACSNSREILMALREWHDDGPKVIQFDPAKLARLAEVMEADSSQKRVAYTLHKRASWAWKPGKQPKGEKSRYRRSNYMPNAAGNARRKPGRPKKAA